MNTNSFKNYYNCYTNYPVCGDANHYYQQHGQSKYITYEAKQVCICIVTSTHWITKHSGKMWHTVTDITHKKNAGWLGHSGKMQQTVTNVTQENVGWLGQVSYWTSSS